ncbi:MAG: nucleoside phosphorylase [Clostridia bacterium]|nr:nucleoside phosphorylase [Clostridia bacterium]
MTDSDRLPFAYDPAQNTPLSPIEPEKDLPAFCLLTQFEDVLKSMVAEFGGEEIAHFSPEMRVFPIYKIRHRETDLALTLMGNGAPVAAMQLDFLFGRGVRYAIGCASCISMKEGYEGEIFLCTKAFRDEGTSYQYLPAGPFVEASGELCKTCREVLHLNGVPYSEVTSWTTDGYFRRTPGRIESMMARGCSVTDMEASALMAVAKARKASFCEMFYSGPFLSGTGYDERNFYLDTSNRIKLFCLALDALARVQGATGI